MSYSTDSGRAPRPAEEWNTDDVRIVIGWFDTASEKGKFPVGEGRFMMAIAGRLKIPRERAGALIIDLGRRGNWSPQEKENGAIFWYKGKHEWHAHLDGW